MSSRRIIFALLLSGAISHPLAAQDNGTVVFRGVNVVPMDGERILRNHTVVVTNGLIGAVGPSSGVEVPSAAVVVEGDGRYLTPGLADMHVHL